MKMGAADRKATTRRPRTRHHIGALCFRFAGGRAEAVLLPTLECPATGAPHAGAIVYDPLVGPRTRSLAQLVLSCQVWGIHRSDSSPFLHTMFAVYWSLKRRKSPSPLT